MQPIVLSANQPAKFYAGGGRLAGFRGTPTAASPEDWVASTTPVRGQSPAGLTTLAGGGTLLDAVRADPMSWLGSADPDIGVLVKLLDAGQRLPLHVHPTREFASAHLASPYGKTEAWIVLEADDGAGVHLGWTRDIDPAELRGWAQAQDTQAMLAATHRLLVRPGDAILCPAGTPHAIDGGILLLEVQEPSDFSMLIEWEGFMPGPPVATLGMDLDEALGCVDRRACSPARLAELRTAAPGSLLPAEAAEFFRVDEVSGRVDAGFGVLIGIAGHGAIAGAWGSTPVSRGSTVVMPAAAGPYTVSGQLTLVRCRGGVS